MVGVLFGLCAAWTATPVAGVPADWPGWEEVPGEAAGWVSQLPEGIDVKEETLASFLKHLTGVLLRDAVLEHWVPEGAVEQAKEALGFSEETLKLYASRHDYPETLAESSPHWARQFVLPPLFRDDRESPLLLRKMWEMTPGDLTLAQRARRTLWLAFARRVLHNFPVSWEYVAPFLATASAPAEWSPGGEEFLKAFRELAADHGGEGRLYGRGSHWFHPRTQALRKTGQVVGWLEDIRECR